MLILECSQGWYGRTEGRTDGSVTISLRNFVGEGIINYNVCNKIISDVHTIMYTLYLNSVNAP